MAAAGQGNVFTPSVGLSWSEAGQRTYRVGLRFTGRDAFSLEVAGIRRAPLGAAAEDIVEVQATLRF